MLALGYRFEVAAAGLVLEPLQKAHAAELFDLLCEPSLYQFIPQDPPVSLAALQDRYETLERRCSPDGTELWLNWVIRREEGAAGLVQATCNDRRQVFLAYEVFLPFRRKGIAAAAVKSVLEHLRVSTGVRQALAYVDTRNTPSVGLLKGLGFEQRRLLRGADWFKGEVSDEFEFERPISALFQT